MKVLVLLLVCLPLAYSKHVSERDANDLERLLKALVNVNHKSPENAVQSHPTEEERNDPAAIVADKEAENRESQDDVKAKKAAQDERNVRVDKDERDVEVTEEERDSQNRDSADNRIIGGDEIDDISKWPYLVSLQYTLSNFLGLLSATGSCTGTLIADRWVLTAAHCVEGDASDPDVWKARLGDEDFGDNIFEMFASWVGLGPAEEEDVVKIIVHPDYVGGSDAKWKNDIALMKLESAAPLDDEDIGLVTLAPQGDYYFPQDGAMCIIKGWGCTSAGGSHSSVARIVEVPKVSDPECSGMWNLYEMQSRMCAGYNLQGMGVCNGDSGGPLVSMNSAGHYVQVGITSFGLKSNPGNAPGVFTRVSHYVDWIQQTIANN